MSIDINNLKEEQILRLPDDIREKAIKMGVTLAFYWNNSSDIVKERIFFCDKFSVSVKWSSNFLDGKNFGTYRRDNCSTDWSDIKAPEMRDMNATEIANFCNDNGFMLCEELPNGNVSYNVSLNNCGDLINTREVILDDYRYLEKGKVKKFPQVEV